LGHPAALYGIEKARWSRASVGVQANSEYLHFEGLNYLPDKTKYVFDLPQHRTRTTAHLTKACHYSFPSVRISCAKSDRQGHYSRDSLLELVGAETRLPDALERISADCTKRQSAAAYDQCMALYPDLMAKAAE